MLWLLRFFFQAEDGIRDGHVTGVQTCALPICRFPVAVPSSRPRTRCSGCSNYATVATVILPRVHGLEIGRASCRGRVATGVAAGSERQRMPVERKSDGRTQERRVEGTQPAATA